MEIFFKRIPVRNPPLESGVYITNLGYVEFNGGTIWTHTASSVIEEDKFTDVTHLIRWWLKEILISDENIGELVEEIAYKQHHEDQGDDFIEKVWKVKEWLQSHTSLKV